jgi:hypothetical protein
VQKALLKSRKQKTPKKGKPKLVQHNAARFFVSSLLQLVSQKGRSSDEISADVTA